MTSRLDPSFRIWGHGPTRVLALHGWLSSSTGWDALLPHLDPELTTWALLDAPGYGAAPGACGFRSWVDHAVASLDSLGWPDAALVGHSMGGLAIQAVLLEAPTRVTQLIGIAAVPANGAGLEGERLELFEQATSDLRAVGAIIAASTGDRHDPAWVARLARRGYSACTPATRAAYLPSWAQSDLHERLTDASNALAPYDELPVDVVVGAHDPSLTADRVELTWEAWYARCRTWTLDGAGHYPADEHPAGLAAVLEEILQPRAGTGAG